MKVLVSLPLQPALNAEKSAALKKTLAEELGLDEAAVLFLPAGVTVQVLEGAAGAHKKPPPPPAPTPPPPEAHHAPPAAPRGRKE